MLVWPQTELGCAAVTNRTSSCVKSTPTASACSACTQTMHDADYDAGWHDITDAGWHNTIDGISLWMTAWRGPAYMQLLTNPWMEFL